MMCKEHNCEKPSSKKNVCEMHYRRLWRLNNKEKSLNIEQRSLEKRRLKKIDWRTIDKKCKVCCVNFKRKSTNQIYCSKPCQNKFFFKKKMMKTQDKLRHNLRSRLRKTLYNKKHGLSPVRHLGCSIKDLKLHLESLFYPDLVSGKQMSWDNYGDWHIDHIKPLAGFDLTDKNQFKEACNYMNLQPLWAKDNQKKAKNIIY